MQKEETVILNIVILIRETIRKWTACPSLEKWILKTYKNCRFFFLSFPSCWPHLKRYLTGGTFSQSSSSAKDGMSSSICLWAGISVLVTIWTTSDTLQKRKHFSQRDTATAVICVQGSRGEYLCFKWSQRKPSQQENRGSLCYVMQNFLQPRGKTFG